METASSRAMSEAPSDTNSLDYGMSPGMAGDLSDSDIPSTQGERFAELPTDGPPPTVEVPPMLQNCSNSVPILQGWGVSWHQQMLHYAPASRR